MDLFVQFDRTVLLKNVTTVHGLRKQVAYRFGVPVKAQVLLTAAGKALRYSCALSELGVFHGTTLRLMLRLRGGLFETATNTNGFNVVSHVSLSAAINIAQDTKQIADMQNVINIKTRDATLDIGAVTQTVNVTLSGSSMLKAAITQQAQISIVNKLMSAQSNALSGFNPTGLGDATINNNTQTVTNDIVVSQLTNEAQRCIAISKGTNTFNLDVGAGSKVTIASILQNNILDDSIKCMLNTNVAQSAAVSLVNDLSATQSNTQTGLTLWPLVALLALFVVGMPMMVMYSCKPVMRLCAGLLPVLVMGGGTVALLIVYILKANHIAVPDVLPTTVNQAALTCSGCNGQNDSGKPPVKGTAQQARDACVALGSQCAGYDWEVNPSGTSVLEGSYTLYSSVHDAGSKAITADCSCPAAPGGNNSLRRRPHALVVVDSLAGLKASDMAQGDVLVINAGTLRGQVVYVNPQATDSDATALGVAGFSRVTIKPGTVIDVAGYIDNTASIGMEPQWLPTYTVPINPKVSIGDVTQWPVLNLLTMVYASYNSTPIASPTITMEASLLPTQAFVNNSLGTPPLASLAPGNVMFIDSSDIGDGDTSTEGLGSPDGQSGAQVPYTGCLLISLAGDKRVVTQADSREVPMHQLCAVTVRVPLWIKGDYSPRPVTTPQRVTAVRVPLPKENNGSDVFLWAFLAGLGLTAIGAITSCYITSMLSGDEAAAQESKKEEEEGDHDDNTAAVHMTEITNKR